MDDRHVSIEILYDGVPLAWASDLLESLSYTDNASGKSDDITLTFCSRATDFLSTTGGFRVEREHDLDVTYYLHNWKKSGDKLRYHCGNFTLDTVRFTGSPRQCVIKGVSVPVAESFTTENFSKTWGSITLRQIAWEMVQKYGMTDLFYWGPDPVISKVTQDKKSDSTFLSEMCDKQGMFLKVYKKALVVFDKATYEARGITAHFWEKDFDGQYEWEESLVGTYTGATISYTVPTKKKTTKGKQQIRAKQQTKETTKQQVINVTVGTPRRMLYINQKADSEAEAQRIAKAKVNVENEKACTVSFAAMEDPEVVASCNIELHDMGIMSGKYFVTKVTHNISGSNGSKMKVSGYRVFERL